MKVFEAGNQGIHLAKLEEELTGQVSRVIISNILDELEEKGVIAGHWVAKEIQIGNSTRPSWVRVFTVAGEQNVYQLKKLHELVTSLDPYQTI